MLSLQSSNDVQDKTINAAFSTSFSLRCAAKNTMPSHLPSSLVQHLPATVEIGAASALSERPRFQSGQPLATFLQWNGQSQSVRFPAATPTTLEKAARPETRFPVPAEQ